MWKYFDLNQPLGELRIRGARQPGKPAKAKGLSVGDQVLMFAGLFLGVVFSAFILEGTPIEQLFTWGKIVASSVCALLITPYAYKQLQVSSDTPFLMQFAFFVQTGIAWQTIINGAGRALH